MNNLPSEIINKILIIKHDEEIKKYKSRIEYLEEVLSQYVFNCEYCNNYYDPSEIHDTICDNRMCEKCMNDNDFFFCEGCKRLAHCDDLEENYCKKCFIQSDEDY